MTDDGKTLNIDDIAELYVAIEKNGYQPTHIQLHPNIPPEVRWALEHWDEYIALRDKNDRTNNRS